jgi:hypothetical protein
VTDEPPIPATTRRNLVSDGGGLPLTAVVTAANASDTSMFQAVVDDVPPICTSSGRRRIRPGRVYADKGYDSAANRADLRRRGIRPRIARRRIESSVRLGRHRFAFVLVACAVVCFNRL